MKGEALRRDAVRWIQDWGEDEVVKASEDAEEGRLFPMAGAEALEELGVGDEPSRPLANSGGTWQGGWLRQEPEEDLTEEVITVRQGGRRCR